MKASTFVPGHISTVFRPVRGASPIETGSLGLGIRLSSGCRAAVSRRDDMDVRIIVNGAETEAPVTRKAVEMMGTDTGFDIFLEHDLPLQQGFGASASGTYAATLCVAELAGLDRTRAIESTHVAECDLGGGLGDLLAIDSEFGVPVRYVAGPPRISGRTRDSGLSFDRLSLVVFDQPLPTKSVLGNPGMMSRIIDAGDRALEVFSEDCTIDGLFRTSNMFSESIGIESDDIRNGMDSIRSEGYHAGMCMLGNSIFSDAPMEVIKRLFPGRRTFSSSSFSGPIKVETTG